MRGLISPVTVVGEARSVEELSSKGGKPYVKLELVVREWRRNPERTSEETEAVLTLIAFGKVSEVASKYISQGEMVAASCRLESRRSADGAYHNLSLFVEQIVLLPSRKSAVETKPPQSIRAARELVKQTSSRLEPLAPAKQFSEPSSTITYDADGEPNDLPF
jgi:single-stranded DNA-binding protein